LPHEGDLLADDARLEHPRLDGQLERRLEGRRLESESFRLRDAVHHQLEHPGVALVGRRSPAIAGQAKPHDAGGFVDAQSHPLDCRAPTVKGSFRGRPI
jgi:hypothetical protein